MSFHKKGTGLCVNSIIIYTVNIVFTATLLPPLTHAPPHPHPHPHTYTYTLVSTPNASAKNSYDSAHIKARCELSAAPPWPPSMFSQ